MFIHSDRVTGSKLLCGWWDTRCVRRVSSVQRVHLAGTELWPCLRGQNSAMHVQITCCVSDHVRPWLCALVANAAAVHQLILALDRLGHNIVRDETLFED